MAFWDELRRRNVFKVAAAYAVVGWLVTQVVTSIEGPLGLPEWFDTAIIVALLAGFPVALLLAWAFELSPDGVRRTSDVSDAPDRPVARSGSALSLLVTAALALAVAYLLFDRFIVQPNASNGANVSSAASVPSAAGIGLAVLPFQNLSSDPEQAYFVTGLSESILNALRRVPELRVIDREASFQFSESSRDPAQIAGLLDVESILDGRVLRDGDHLRVVTELTRVENAELIWSETFDFDYEDIFSIQDRITEKVATALQVSLGVLESRVPGMTRDADAYVEFLTAMGRLIEFTPAALRDVTEGLQRAIALDPDFTLAIIRLGGVYQLRATLAADPDQVRDYRAARDRAYALARSQLPDAPQLQQVDAQLAAARGDWNEADRLFAKAQKAELGTPFLSALSRASYAAFLGRAGRFDDALDIYEQARALNPTDPQIRWGLGSLYAARGDVRRGLEEIDRAAELDDTNSILMVGNALFKALALRDRDEIEERLAVVEAVDAENNDLWVTMHGLLDDPAAALAELHRRADAGGPDTPIRVGILAHWAAYFGDPVFALDLMQTIPNENGLLGLLIWEPGMRDVRRLPGFRALVERMGLADYWREHGWPDLCAPAGDDFACR